MVDRRTAIEPTRDKLCGVMIRSTIDRGIIKSISIPKTEDDIIVVSANDFGGANRIKVIDAEFPIFASTQVEYAGQPILAIFSYDIESSQLLAQEILIEYEKSNTTSVELPSYSISWGDAAAFIADETKKKVNGVCYFDRRSTQPHSILKVKAVPTSDGVRIECPTQWPFHVRKTVSVVTGIPLGQVIVKAKDYYSPKDEYLIAPSTLAAIAAVAARKGKCPAEVSTIFPVFKPELVISRTSVLDNDGNVVAEDVSASADLGACPLFQDETAAHIISGLMPLYRVPNVSIRASLFSTSKAPANFFGTLGFSESICSSEMQISKIASETGRSPMTWRLDHIVPYPEYQKRISTESYDALKKCISEISHISGFQRKHFAFQQQKAKKNKLNSLLNYARGIGLACAPGINGFTNQFKELPEYKIRMTLDSNGKLILNTSFPRNSYVNAIWSSLISKRMKISQDDITFEDIASPDVVNSGPDVLSRDIGNIANLISDACDSINSRRFKEPLPISAEKTFIPEKKTVIFDSHAWVAVVLELEIDPVMIIPVVKKCWVNSYFGIVYNRDILETKMRRVIESTIIELGGKPDSDMENVISINSRDTGSASSANQALKGALEAAFSSALSQAMNVEHIKLPVNSEYLLEVIKGQ